MSMFFEQDKAGSDALARFCARMAEVGNAVRLPAFLAHVAEHAEENERARQEQQHDAPPVPAYRGVWQSYAAYHGKLKGGAQQVKARIQAQQADFNPFRQAQADSSEAP